MEENKGYDPSNEGSVEEPTPSIDNTMSTFTEEARKVGKRNYRHARSGSKLPFSAREAAAVYGPQTVRGSESAVGGRRELMIEDDQARELKQGKEIVLEDVAVPKGGRKFKNEEICMVQPDEEPAMDVEIVEVII